jgi:parvulin-like peptidyl-prolyl isomerase
MRLISRKFSEDIVKDLAVTQDEVQAEYESLKANHRMDTADIAHVLVRVTGTDPVAWEDGKKEIDAAYARIEAGDDFADVVKEFSDDEMTRETGGVFDDAMRGNLGPEFDQRMFDVPLNEVTQPFKSRAGWHIMKVTERGVAPLEGPIREQLGNALLQQRKAQTIEKRIADARSAMSVSITLPPEAPTTGGSSPISAPSLLDNAT